jgi:hypothetical protein
MSRPRIVVLLAFLLVVLSPAPSRAVFHLAHIAEVMSGAGGNPAIQYVEIRMNSGSQQVVHDTRLTAFNCDGSSFSVLLLVPTDVTNQGVNVRWIMASPSGAAFLAASGITPDFTWDNSVTGNINPTCGMVCWGAPGIVPPAPTWDASNPNNYVDCVGYGGYTGPTKTSTHDGTPTSGTPTTLPPGDGTLSLTRTGFTGNNIADFALACPTPENNNGNQGNFGACTPPTTTTVTTTTVTTTTSSTTSTTLGPNKCAGSKIKATGKKAGCKLGVYAKAAGSGDPPDGDKLTTCETKFSQAFAKAEAKATKEPCSTTGDAGDIEAKVDAFVDDVRTEIDVAPAPSKCQQSKLKAAGKKAKCRLKLVAGLAGKGTPIDPTKDATCKSKFSSASVKAEGQGDCGTAAGDTAVIEGKVDSFVTDVDTELSP